MVQGGTANLGARYGGAPDTAVAPPTHDGRCRSEVIDCVILQQVLSFALLSRRVPER